MGNWRTVNITGSMREADAERLRALLDRADHGDLDNGVWTGWGDPYDCLSFDSLCPGLAGLGPWPAATMNRCGNLAERDYDVEDVASALVALLRFAPSMLLKVHCGGEYESEECVATISVGEGVVAVGKPEQPTVAGPPDGQVIGDLFTNLLR